MNKNFKYIVIAFILLIIAVILYKRKKDLVVYSLPNSVVPEVFGPSYWKAFHNLADRVPCIHCREEAQKFMMFFHDRINKKLGKPFFNEENYNQVKNSICNE